MKRTIAILITIIAIIQCFSMVSFAEAPNFTDVPENAWYAEAVKWAVENNITAGTSSTTFNPKQICTRAQIVTFIWRAAGSPTTNDVTNPFIDVNENAYYYKAILWAVKNGITSGTSYNRFSPNMACTRAQIVTFIWKSDGSPEPTEINAENCPFEDVNPSAYYAKAVYYAVEKGITSGVDLTHFAPNKICTRAEAVTFLWKDNLNGTCVHHYEIYGVVQPTCNMPLTKYYRCVLCDNFRYDFENTPWSHNLQVTEEVPATDTTAGYTKYKCNLCHSEWTINHPAHNECSHENFTYEITGYPTYETPGTWIKTCEDCGSVIEETMDLNGTEYYPDDIASLTARATGLDLSNSSFAPHPTNTLSKIRVFEALKFYDGTGTRPDGTPFTDAMLLEEGGEEELNRYKDMAEFLVITDMFDEKPNGLADAIVLKLIRSPENRAIVLDPRWNIVSGYSIKVGAQTYTMIHLYELKDELKP